MRCSIIIPVLDSHEIFRRQMLHLSQIVPKDFELIIVDDGSDEPLTYLEPLGFPFQLLQTNDKRPWTNDLARDVASKVARGEYLLMTDIDHILTAKAIENVTSFEGDLLLFARRVAELDEQGKVRNIGRRLTPHVNTFAVRKSVFDEMGGYGSEYAGYGSDRVIRQKYNDLLARGLVEPVRLGATIYVITERRWFHNLRRTSVAASREQSSWPTSRPDGDGAHAARRGD